LGQYFDASSVWSGKLLARDAVVMGRTSRAFARYSDALVELPAAPAAGPGWCGRESPVVGRVREKVCIQWVMRAGKNNRRQSNTWSREKRFANYGDWVVVEKGGKKDSGQKIRKRIFGLKAKPSFRTGALQFHPCGGRAMGGN